MINAPVLIDTGPLGRLVHPNTTSNRDITSWFIRLLDTGVVFVLPEIADYETRRSLILQGFSWSIARLDRLKADLQYLPLTTETMLKAADLWATARRLHRQTAGNDALDGDVILAAQALQVGGMVVTENIGHLGLFVEAKTWREID